jgi:putative SOS response-associated peptidase YedK
VRSIVLVGSVHGGDLFAFAGLWESWNNPSGEVVETCILTTEANEWMRPLRERMPVIVGGDVDALWLESRSASTCRMPTGMQAL